jgi:hypothetical protein
VPAIAVVGSGIGAVADAGPIGPAVVSPVALRNVTAYSCRPASTPGDAGTGTPTVGAVSGGSCNPVTTVSAGPAVVSPAAVVHVTA